jgi:hypothetical protein
MALALGLNLEKVSPAALQVWRILAMEIGLSVVSQGLVVNPGLLNYPISFP